MELFKELLINILKEDEIEINFKQFKFNAEKLTQNETYKMLKKIKLVLENHEFDDFECIERIILIFENAGCKIANRHDL